MENNKCYIIEFGKYITDVEVLNEIGEYSIIRILDNQYQSTFKIKKKNLYTTRKDAQTAINNKKRKPPNHNLAYGEHLVLECVKELNKKSYWSCHVHYNKNNE